MNRRQRQDDYRLEAFSGIGVIITAASLVGLVVSREFSPVLAFIGIAAGYVIIESSLRLRAKLHDNKEDS
jgi:hypothetical protein